MRKKKQTQTTMSTTNNADTNTQQSQATPITPPARIVVKTEDLDVLSNWVKKELFEKVKFIYDANIDLRLNGEIYWEFVRTCKDRLIGLKGSEAVGEYRKLYVELLWQEANQKRRNLIANGLTMRRSSVYSGMQNQFIGKSQPS